MAVQGGVTTFRDLAFFGNTALSGGGGIFFLAEPIG